MGFSRQEYWSGLPCPPPGDLPDPGIKPAFSVAPAMQADSLPLSHWGKPFSNLTRLTGTNASLFHAREGALSPLGDM